MKPIVQGFRSFGPLGLAFLALFVLPTMSVRAQITGPGVFDWGSNNFGQLGNNSTTSSSTPVQVLGVGGSGTLSNITAVSGGSAHSLALSNTGTIYAWGYNNDGQLGNNTTTNALTPVQVLGVGGTGTLSNISSVAGGGYNSLALSRSGSVYGWGGNVYGMLGNGTTTNSSTPVQVLGIGGTGTLSNITAIAAGYAHSLALSSSGSVYAWGYNASGQLGNNTNLNSSTPVQVLGVGGVGTLSNITAIAGGTYHSLAVSSSGAVYAWGSNSEGQLGNNTMIDSSKPVQVMGVGGSGTLSNIVSVAAGYEFSLALSSSGSVYAWGFNPYGQLGNNTTTTSLTPVLVNFPANGSAKVIALSAGLSTSFALESDGSLWAWGANQSGTYGNGTTTTSYTPIEVYTPSGGYGITSFSVSNDFDNGLALMGVVPEPSICLVIGALGLIGARRLRKMHSRGNC